MRTRLAFAAIALATPALADVEAIHYGRSIVERTYAVIGPEVTDPGMRYAGNNLACASCHLDGGRTARGLALVGVSAKYPKPLPGGGAGSLADRVNGCMIRSMNGRPLPEGGAEMRAVLAYLAMLTADAGSFGDPAEVPVPLPAAAAPDPVRGQRLYLAECAACHGADAYCRDAAVAVETAKDFIARKHNQMARAEVSAAPAAGAAPR